MAAGEYGEAYAEDSASSLLDVHTLARSIADSAEKGSRFDQIPERISAPLQATVVYVCQTLQGPRRLDLVAHHNLPRDLARELGSVRASSSLLAAQAARSGRLAIADDRQRLERSSLDAEILERTRSASAFATPLRFAGRLLGVLFVGLPRTPAWRAADLEAVRLMSDLLAVAAVAQGPWTKGNGGQNQLAKLREEWIAVVGHDLRQPLTVILLHAALLLRDHAGANPALVARAAKHILACGTQLKRQIADLLDASLLEVRKLELDLKSTDLVKLAAEVVDRLADKLSEHPVQIAAPDDLPAMMLDPERIEQVLGNLLTNAAKYGKPAGSIRLAIERRGAEVELSITNEGPGIPAAELPRLFERFFRVHATKGNVAGLGLGLYITRGLVEAHGGRIGVESEPGKHTTFRFRLPLKRSAVYSA